MTLLIAKREYETSSISAPPLGCGNGGLDWEIIRPSRFDILHCLKASEGCQILN